MFLRVAFVLLFGLGCSSSNGATDATGDAHDDGAPRDAPADVPEDTLVDAPSDAAPDAPNLSPPGLLFPDLEWLRLEGLPDHNAHRVELKGPSRRNNLGTS